MGNDREFLNQLGAILERNFNTQDFGVKHVASEMNISDRQLQRRVRALTSQTPILYMRCYRLEKSLHYLREGVPVGEVAKTVGFSSHAYFSSCFKAMFGITPNCLQTNQVKTVGND